MQQRFDGFLDYVCGNIISKRERENARNELYDHLMCTYECNLAQGMDEEHAAIEAGRPENADPLRIAQKRLYPLVNH